MINRCNECCYGTLIETETHQYYKCAITEIIKNDRIRNGWTQLDGCEYFRQNSNTIFENIFD